MSSALKHSFVCLTFLGGLALIGALQLTGCAEGMTLASGAGGEGGESDGDSSAGGFTSSSSSTSASTGVTTSASSSQASVGATTGPGPGPASSSSGSGGCDNSGDCGSCGTCAINGACNGVMSACQSSLDCTDFMDCLSPCGPSDTACFDACANQHATGYELYTDVAVCVVCQNCYNDCDGAANPCM